MIKFTFSNSYLDSVSKLSPKICMYNQEIAKFMLEVNIKYGILLDYTVLEISEVLLWAETYQVLAKQTFNRKPNQYTYQLKIFQLFPCR